jgi:hypothetical protein
MRSTKLRKTLVAEPATGPQAPAQTQDPLTTLGTEIWSVIREERQSPRIIAKLLKQPNPSLTRPISAFEKLSGGGHTLLADLPCNFKNPV